MVHTQRNSPGDIMRRGQHTFPSEYYEHRHIVFICCWSAQWLSYIMPLILVIIGWWISS